MECVWCGSAIEEADVCSCVPYVWHMSCDDGISGVFATCSVCLCGICVTHMLCVVSVCCMSCVCMWSTCGVCVCYELCVDMSGVDVCFADLLVSICCAYLLS